MASDQVLLKIENLKTGFQTGDGFVQAVRGVSFHVDKGERLGIVGESGCGKSVSMLSIMHLLEDNATLKADAIDFNGENLAKKTVKEMRKYQGNEISMIFQDPMTSLNPLFTIGEQICSPLRRHLGMSKKAARLRAIEVLNQVGIPDPEKRLKQYPHELSGGMRQRVMIAIAISCNPKLLIADEPTTALDVTIQAQILDLMRKMKEQYDMSLILITHDLGVIASMCTRVIVMYGGLIMEEGSVRDIFYRTAHPYTQGLLESIPRADKEKLVPIFGTPPDLLNPPKGCPFAARCKYTMRLCQSCQPELTAVTSEASEGETADASVTEHRAACWLHHPTVREKLLRERGTSGQQDGADSGIWAILAGAREGHAHRAHEEVQGT